MNSNTLEALDRGVVHLPQTPMLWEERKQKNVYLAGHRVGYPGTGNLPGLLQPGQDKDWRLGNSEG